MQYKTKATADSEIPSSNRSAKLLETGFQFLLGGFLLMTITGCGSKPTPCSVSGNVTFDGKPIENGSLKFEPVGKSDSPGGRSVITGGKYTVALDQGMLPGQYRAVIYAMKETGKEITNAEVLPGDPTGPRKETVQFLPEKYNSASELQVDFKAGENSKDFDLTP